MDYQPQQQSHWQAWDAGGVEEDSWEDVTEVTLPPDNDPLPTINEISQKTPTIQNSIQNIVTSSSSTNDLNNLSNKSTFPVSLSNTSSIQTDQPSISPTKSVLSTTDQSISAVDDQLQQQLATLKSQLRNALDRASTAERKNIALQRTRNSNNNTTEIESKLHAALKEGEKLSVRIAEKEQTVRTLKNTMKQKDTELEDSIMTVQALGAKLEASVSKIKQLETNERSTNDAKEAAERRLRELEIDLRGNKSSSAALDTLRLQLETLRKNQQSSLETLQMRLTAEKDSALEEKDKKFAKREEEIEKSMSELRQHLNQVVQHSSWREDQLKRENDELRQRCQQLESRNEELAEALPGATRPLIRQVEALQAAASERENAKEIAERASIRRVRIAEKTASEARQREQAAEEKVSQVLAKVAGLEERLRIAQKEIRQNVDETEKVKRECFEKEEKAIERVKDAEERIKRAERMSEEGREEAREARKMMVEGMEGGEEREKELRGMVAEAEAKIAMLMERERELRKNISSSPSLNGNESGSHKQSPSSSNHLKKQLNHIINSNGKGGVGEEAEEDGVYERERLSTSLKLRRGEVEKLQAQLESKEKATRALAEEVVSLTSRLEAFEKSKDGAERELETKKLEALTKRHETLLELLGEREERIGELEADLVDVKTMYKEQVTELLLRIERLNS